MSKALKLILREIGLAAAEHNLKAWAVGGFARDRILGKKTEDVDICVEGDFSPLTNFCVLNYGAKITAFKTFGTARAELACGLKLDFVRCRKEVYPAPAALPRVSPSGIKDDLARRDFTANALALSILPNEFLKKYDFFNSEEAILEGYLAVLHEKSFLDDPTRIFRALRFAARFSWKLEKETESLLKKAVAEDYINLLSRKRVANEFMKILGEKRPYAALKSARKYGISEYIFKNLRFSSALDGLKNTEEKIAYLTLLQGAQGEEFLASLQLCSGEGILAKEVLKWRKNATAPQKPLSKAAIKIIKLYRPKIESFKLKPCFIKAADLAALGESGQRLGKKLKSAAKAQFLGKVKNRREALSCIKKGRAV